MHGCKAGERWELNFGTGLGGWESVKFLSWRLLDFAGIHQRVKGAWKNPSGWTIPQGTDHVSLLITELILKGSWTMEDSHRSGDLSFAEISPRKKSDMRVYKMEPMSLRIFVLDRRQHCIACGTCRDNILNMVQAVLDKGQPSKWLSDLSRRGKGFFHAKLRFFLFP